MARRVTLTFDNGPTPEVTPQVLDCLARNDLKSTFFVIGTKASSAEGTAIIERASREGHCIGNHTFTHTTPLGELGRDAALREFEQAEEVLMWLDRPNRLFRPYGRAGRVGTHLIHPAIVERLLTGGFSCVLWNCVPGDWRDPDGWVARGIEECRSREWSLVVIHDTATGAMAHLERFIHLLRDEGFELRQDYPPDCVPIANGEIVGPLDRFIAEVPL
jgi:peptidoglycan/xylan/chitin deacetylase (PgdA/CDA1 family)